MSVVKGVCVLVAAGVLWASGVRAASPGAMRALGTAIADAVEQVLPCVVVIRTQSVVYQPVRDLYHGRLYGIPEQLSGQGSGVIIDKAGHVLTSHHVIQQATTIEVVLNDGRKFPAKVVGRDPATDLAVVRIDAPADVELSPITVGDSDRLRVGEFVIAVGSPFSLDSSVTMGIVSQKGRYMGMLPYEDFIQTDASINPGNSGGPLVDVDGRMVGINAAIQTGGHFSRGNIGIGFAVPARLAMTVADSLIRTGRVVRPWIGVRLAKSSATERARVPGVRSGVVVAEVLSNTPASRCGLREGDLLTHADGRPLDDPRDLQIIVVQRQPGEIVALTVIRGTQRLEIELVTERMPE